MIAVAGLHLNTSRAYSDVPEADAPANSMKSHQGEYAQCDLSSD
jgi:hypothetical protein